MNPGLLLQRHAVETLLEGGILLRRMDVRMKGMGNVLQGTNPCWTLTCSPFLLPRSSPISLSEE